MKDNEYNNIFTIPVNYTDSGKVLGGMFEMRNVIEAVILLIALGYPELKLIPMTGTTRIIVMVITLIPLVIFALIGIDGDSLFQYAGHMIRYFLNKRKLHFRRIGVKHVNKEEKNEEE